MPYLKKDRDPLTPNVVDSAAEVSSVSAGKGQTYDEGRAALAPAALPQNQVAKARHFYDNHGSKYSPAVVAQIQGAVGAPASGALDAPTIQGVGAYQKDKELGVDGMAGKTTLGSMFGGDIRVGSASKAAAPKPVVTSDDASEHIKTDAPLVAADKTPQADAATILTATQVKSAVRFYDKHASRYPIGVINAIQTKVGVNAGPLDDTTIQASAAWQESEGSNVDGMAGGGTLKKMFGKDIRPAPASGGALMKGNFKADLIKDGKPIGKHGVAERRVKSAVYGEPLPEELVDVGRYVHTFAAEAYERLKAAAIGDGVPADHMEIVSGYRSVSKQKAIWARGLAKTKRKNPNISENEAVKLTRKWVAKPGGSAHHTGLALDFAVPGVGQRGEVSKRSDTYAWMCKNAAGFGFYPYLAEGWHWEYNPPGNVERVHKHREALVANGGVLNNPKEIEQSDAISEGA